MKTTFTPTECASRRWMIVDDNEDVLSLMQAIAARFSDATLECYHSPQTALTAFRAAPEAFSLVITDLEMPGMSGIELCRELHEVSPAQKVLLSTGSEVLTDAQAAQNGFCGLLHKPFPFASLQRALAAAGMLEIPAENNPKQFAALTMA
jgi:two-component system cell cycle sensor histidine kinase/response regulator CckA